MAATVADFAASLQEFYLPELNKQLNDTVFILKEMDRGKFKWNGKHTIVHAWTGRNTGIGFSDGKIPTAGKQTTINLTVTAKRYYGAFSVDGMTIEAAPKGGGHEFIDWAEREMEGLIDDIKVDMNQKTISGGLVKGYLNEHKASTTTTANQVTATIAANASAVQVWEYSGHFDEFNGTGANLEVDPATPATWVPISLIRCDTFNPVDYTTVTNPPTNMNIFVVDYDEEAMTLTLRVGTNNATGDTHGFTTATVAAGFAIAVLIRAENAVDSAAAQLGRVYSSTAVKAVEHDANGIFSCLSDPNYYGHTRNVADLAALPAVAADGTAPILRCRVRTMATTGNHARTAITGPRMERMKNIVEVDSGRKIDSIFINPFFKSTYSGLATLVQNTNAQKAGNLDVGFAYDGYSHGNTPMRSDRHVPRGLMIFYHRKSWKVAVLGEGKFADQDGSVFSRTINGRDEWEGFWRKYYNIVNVRPHTNMILTGFALV